jgi:hypothetical protein
MPFRELTDEDWEHVRNVVLDGALYLTRALIGPMVENKYGNILFFVGDGAYSGHGSVVLTFQQPRWRWSALSSLCFGYQERLHLVRRSPGFPTVNPSLISRCACLG